MVVTAISDEFLQIDVAYLSNITPDETNEVLASEFMKASPVTTGVNAYLVSTGGRTVLADTGGASYSPDMGQLLLSLEAAGVSSGDIDAVLMTHLHVYHICGLVTAGKATFPKAELHVDENDVAYFTSAENRAAVPKPFKVFFDKTKEALDAYAGRAKTFKGEIEVVPGIKSRELFGHTPGYRGYVVGTGDDALLISGDIVHVGPIQMVSPISASPSTSTGRRPSLRERPCWPKSPQITCASRECTSPFRASAMSERSPPVMATTSSRRPGSTPSTDRGAASRE